MPPLEVTTCLPRGATQLAVISNLQVQNRNLQDKLMKATWDVNNAVHQAKAMNDLIYSVCRDVVWRTTKFITSVPQENRFAKAILDNLDIPGYQGQTR
jgi:hypothetical protein